MPCWTKALVAHLPRPSLPSGLSSNCSVRMLGIPLVLASWPYIHNIPIPPVTPPRATPSADFAQQTVTILSSGNRLPEGCSASTHAPKYPFSPRSQKCKSHHINQPPFLKHVRGLSLCSTICLQPVGMGLVCPLLQACCVPAAPSCHLVCILLPGP